MSNESNPYDASYDEIHKLTFRQRLLAVAVGGLVVVASIVIMLALLFGILVAIEGRRTPAPISFSALMASPLGRFFTLGSFAILPIALLFGVFSTWRVLRVQRNLLETRMRRDDLKQQLASLRE